MEIAAQIADALDAAHERGIVHRDLKPANVKLTADGRVKVLDFGLAKLGDRESGPAPELTHSPTLTMGHTGAGMLLGTAAYMSPEQARGQAVDKRADIWAFGCVLFEMLTGRSPFGGATLTDTLAAIVDRDPDWRALPAATSPDLQHLVRRCLEKDPKRRLRDIGDVPFHLAPPPDTRAGDGSVRAVGPAWIAATLLVAVASIAATVLVLRRPATQPRPFRSSIIAPPGTAFTERDLTEHPQFALSPDGTRLAFVAATGTARPQLWVRSLALGSAQTIAGSEDAAGPFWSPDSRAVAFFARNKLKKAALDGSPPQELATVTFDIRSGAWSRDGVILFPEANGGRLLQVADSGGPFSPASVLDESRNETAHRWPQFLPNGRSFLFFVASATPANSGVYLGTLGSVSKKLVMNAQANAVFVPPGSLLFERNGALTRQRFDPQTGGLSGDPEPLGDRILGLPGPGYLPLSAANDGTLAFWNTVHTPSELVWFDAMGRELGHVGLGGLRYDAPVLSPDGTKVLVSQRDEANMTDLLQVDLATGRSSRVTFTRGSGRFAIWSADGQDIVYSANFGGPAQLVRKAASGAGAETIIAGPGEHYVVFPEQWSRDGQFVCYVVAARTGFDVWSLQVMTHKAQPVLASPANEVQPQLSPDGRWIAYTSDESGAWEVYVQGFNGREGKWLVSSGGGSQPMWRGDGRELFYVAQDGRLFAVDVGGGEAFVSGPLRTLFQTALPPMLAPYRSSYAVAPDGRRFLLTSLGSRRESAITIVVNGMSK